ncbi:class I poly(R)-hydroxyalkanoic acid synthase [Nereida sp. MMG025]|uniref:class I poly(R)-hydroxyalkanoic acid synthase n=1 Tax=Nereida sp. MMG025 TaxID=2909981 RepID=UPI001F28E4E0|nr:class I poly(R)-hydroxyalkanoic acid synthase [Nereida sp. MMG025]MCF6443849.1 alpha/beta hydrolase [Nereida sp. MMG025]
MTMEESSKTSGQTDTGDTDASAADDKITENLAKIEALSTRLTKAMQHKRPVNPALEGPGGDLMMKAANAYMTEMMRDPGKLFETQVAFWGKSFKHYLDAQSALATGKLVAPKDDTPTDRRFKNPLWDTHPYFNFIKQQYFHQAEAIANAVNALDDLEDADRKRLTYFTSQIVDMMAPTNFLTTNPDALEKAVATEGESLVQGLENLVRDIEANDGDLLVTLADKNAFKVGENLGTTPGKVVFRNRMFELIQYAPTTEQVHETPLVIFPPWINKFYVLDLKEQNSLLKWIVDQGFTLFVVSWVNPDESYADVGLEDYIQEGYMAAIAEAKKISGTKKVNAVGYCIAGTTLSLTLSKMKQDKDKSINSATFFTTLTDFSDRGEVGVFLEDDFVDGIEKQVQQDGVLNSYFMSRTFSYLRSNDLIYQPAIRSYMLGEAPPAFDLLFWNGDGTNLPGKMAIEYLRGLCQRDEFASDGFDLFGQTLKIKDVNVPVCAIACEADHIAAWKSSFNGVKKMGSKDKTFILSESGHIAGIVNPVSKNKYGFYTNSNINQSADDWKETADFTPKQSWWPTWGEWLSGKSGKMIPARRPGDKGHKTLDDAPGTYVVAAVGD